MKSPNWLEDEIMLALDLYVNKDLSWINKMSDATFEIKALSKLLNALDLYSEKPANFRTTGSIRMKLANFMALDEKYSKKSLGNVGGLDRKMWEKYKNDPTKLHECCIQIIKEHLISSDEDIKQYIDIMQLKGSESGGNKDFGSFVRNLNKKITYYEKLANVNPEYVYSQKVIESCECIRKALEWVHEEDIISFESDIVYKEHAGINLKPIKSIKKTVISNISSEEKIGAFVRRTFTELVAQDKLTDEIVEQLLLRKYSRDNFGIKPTFLIKITDEIDLKEQLKDEFGNVRYWTKPIEIHGTKYCICKEWFENQRERYIKWLSTVDIAPFAMINKQELKNILEYLIETDSKKVIISKQEMINKFPMATIQDVINALIDKGVLALFQGSAREYVIDDYDILYEMIENPESFTGE